MKKVSVIIGIVLGVLAMRTMPEGDAYLDFSNGPFLFSFFLIVMSVVLIYSGARKEPVVAEKQNNINEYDDKINSLKELKDSGILTNEEYALKLNSVEFQNLGFNPQIENSSNYIKLRNLFDDGFLTKQEFENKVGILKKTLLPNNVKEESYFEGLRVFTNDDLNNGFKDEKGITVIEPIYEFAENFKNGLALVRRNGKFGFIDILGNVVIDIKFDNAYSFDNERALVFLENKKFYIDKSGEKVGNY